MNKENAYSIIGKHIFTAHLKYEESGTIIILADTITEATEKAQQYFGLKSVIVERAQKTYDSQIYV